VDPDAPPAQQEAFFIANAWHLAIIADYFERSVRFNKQTRETRMPRLILTPVEWGKIVANAWIDPNFGDKLTTEPAEAIRSFLKLDADAEVQIWEIPPKPADLSRQQIEDIRDGKAASAIVPMFSC
jgi:hypothetical protein